MTNRKFNDVLNCGPVSASSSVGISHLHLRRIYVSRQTAGRQLSITGHLGPGRVLHKSAGTNTNPSDASSPSPTSEPKKEDQNKSPHEKAFERLEWRSIGPANMGGRTADVEGVPGDPSIVYVATASGGLWKTTNGGVTWKPIFERQGTISIGDIALAPSNTDVVWVGTGESNTRNSVSFGDGVYKSTDGGQTWQHMGLKDSERISAIAIHPQNPEVVYVGALGHAFGPNEERGVFMTTDGGKTWTRTLYIDREHGVSDLDIDPTNPNILYALCGALIASPGLIAAAAKKAGYSSQSTAGAPGRS